MPIDLIAPPHTPFDVQGRLNLPVVEQQAEHLKSNRVTGVFVCGSTGEGPSLTTGERKQLLEAWVNAAKPRGLTVIAQVGSCRQPDSIELARHASECGADAVAAMAPYYFRPGNVADLVWFVEPIAQAAGELPFYFYDIPVMTGVNVPTIDFLRLATERIPQFRGVKFTNPDMLQLQRCLEFAGEHLDIWYGCDEALLAAYSLGVKAAVGSTYNFMAPVYHEMVRLWEDGDADSARGHQLLSVKTVQMLAGFGYMGAAKRTMSLFGIDCGVVRPPLKGISNEQFEQIKRYFSENQLA